jgi:hypothetical protein
MEKEEGQVMVTQLLQQIGRLQMELEWLKKVLAALMPLPSCLNCLLFDVQAHE